MWAHRPLAKHDTISCTAQSVPALQELLWGLGAHQHSADSSIVSWGLEYRGQSSRARWASEALVQGTYSLTLLVCLTEENMGSSGFEGEVSFIAAWFAAGTGGCPLWNSDKGVVYGGEVFAATCRSQSGMLACLAIDVTCSMARAGDPCTAAIDT